MLRVSTQHCSGKEVKTSQNNTPVAGNTKKQTVYTYDANDNQITKTADGKT